MTQDCNQMNLSKAAPESQMDSAMLCLKCSEHQEGFVWQHDKPAWHAVMARGSHAFCDTSESKLVSCMRNFSWASCTCSHIMLMYALYTCRQSGQAFGAAQMQVVARGRTVSGGRQGWGGAGWGGSVDAEEESRQRGGCKAFQAMQLGEISAQECIVHC